MSLWPVRRREISKNKKKKRKKKEKSIREDERKNKRKRKYLFGCKGEKDMKEMEHILQFFSF